MTAEEMKQRCLDIVHSYNENVQTERESEIINCIYGDIEVIDTDEPR